MDGRKGDTNEMRVLSGVVYMTKKPRCFHAISGRGAGDPQNCPNFRLWQMAIPMQYATRPYTARHCRSGPKMSENAQFWGRVYFPTQYIGSCPKTAFWGTFQCKAYYTRSLSPDIWIKSPSRTLIELRNWNRETLQLYRYRQVLGGMGYQNFSARGRRAINANLGPHIISETTGARKLK